MRAHKQPAATAAWSDYLDIKTAWNRLCTFLERVLPEVYCSLSHVKVSLPENENVNIWAGFWLGVFMSETLASKYFIFHNSPKITGILQSVEDTAYKSADSVFKRASGSYTYFCSLWFISYKMQQPVSKASREATQCHCTVHQHRPTSDWWAPLYNLCMGIKVTRPPTTINSNLNLTLVEIYSTSECNKSS